MFGVNKDVLFLSIQRIFLSLIFILAGLKHLFFTDIIVQRMSELPLAPVLEWGVSLKFHAFASGGVLFLGGICLFLGFYTKRAALALLLVLIPITLTVQLQGFHTSGPLFKNIAIIGGLLYFINFGSGNSLSLDKEVQKTFKKEKLDA